MKDLKWKRVLLKLSGESLVGDGSYGISPEMIKSLALDLKTVFDLGIELCIVIGGGNIYRGLSGAARGMDRTTGDYMGMLATVMNSLALQNAFNSGVKVWCITLNVSETEISFNKEIPVNLKRRD